MNWLRLSDIGNSRIVKSMMVWMLITPVLAKILEPIETFKLSFIESESGFLLKLPFSWQVFFFCALFFTVANLIYSYKCPSLISKYRNYIDFEATENSLHKIISSFWQNATEDVVRENFYDIGTMVAKYTPNESVAKEWTSEDTSGVNWRKGIDSLTHSDPTNKPDIFSSAREVLGKLYPKWASACAFFYALGFLCIGWVVVQNTIYVFKQLYA